MQNSAATALATASAAPITITQRNPDTIRRLRDGLAVVFPGLHFLEYRWPRAWSIEFALTARLNLANSS
jgi:hypothetical protein